MRPEARAAARQSAISEGKEKKAKSYTNLSHITYHPCYPLTIKGNQVITVTYKKDFSTFSPILTLMSKSIPSKVSLYGYRFAKS